jgi:hypothetical protein
MNSRIKRRRISKYTSESEEEDYEDLNAAGFEEESDAGEEFSEDENDQAKEIEESTKESGTEEESEDENDAIHRGLIAYPSLITR